MYYGSPVVTGADVIRECGLEAEYYGYGEEDEDDYEATATVEELREEWVALQALADAHGLPAARFRAAVEAEVCRGYTKVDLSKVSPARWVRNAKRVAYRQIH